MDGAFFWLVPSSKPDGHIQYIFSFSFAFLSFFSELDIVKVMYCFAFGVVQFSKNIERYL